MSVCTFVSSGHLRHSSGCCDACRVPIHRTLFNRCASFFLLLPPSSRLPLSDMLRMLHSYIGQSEGPAVYGIACPCLLRELSDQGDDAEFVLLDRDAPIARRTPWMGSPTTPYHHPVTAPATVNTVVKVHHPQQFILGSPRRGCVSAIGRDHRSKHRVADHHLIQAECSSPFQSWTVSTFHSSPNVRTRADVVASLVVSKWLAHGLQRS